MLIVIQLLVLEYPCIYINSLRLCKTGFYQTLQPWPGVAYNTPNRTKTNPDKPIINQLSPPCSWKFWGEAYRFRPPKVYTNAASSLPSITPGTQRVTHLLGRQGKQVWLIVMQVSMKVGWWNIALVLRDLAEEIYRQFSYYFCNLAIILQFSYYFAI